MTLTLTDVDVLGLEHLGKSVKGFDGKGSCVAVIVEVGVVEVGVVEVGVVHSVEYHLEAGLGNPLYPDPVIGGEFGNPVEFKTGGSPGCKLANDGLCDFCVGHVGNSTVVRV